MLCSSWFTFLMGVFMGWVLWLVFLAVVALWFLGREGRDDGRGDNEDRDA